MENIEPYAERALTLIAAQKQMQDIVDHQQKHKWTDKEGDHVDADALLCAALCGLGGHELVATYDEISKWYA